MKISAFTKNVVYVQFSSFQNFQLTILFLTVFCMMTKCIVQHWSQNSCFYRHLCNISGFGLCSYPKASILDLVMKITIPASLKKNTTLLNNRKVNILKSMQYLLVQSSKWNRVVYTHSSPLKTRCFNLFMVNAQMESKAS